LKILRRPWLGQSRADACDAAAFTAPSPLNERRFNSYYICCGIKRGALLSHAADVGIGDAAYLIAAG
jgi:hypothetical protein